MSAKLPSMSAMGYSSTIIFSLQQPGSYSRILRTPFIFFAYFSASQKIQVSPCKQVILYLRFNSNKFCRTKLHIYTLRKFFIVKKNKVRTPLGENWLERYVSKTSWQDDFIIINAEINHIALQAFSNWKMTLKLF